MHILICAYKIQHSFYPIRHIREHMFLLFGISSRFSLSGLGRPLRTVKLFSIIIYIKETCICSIFTQQKVFGCSHAT